MCVESLLRTKYALCELRSLLEGPCEYDHEAGSSVRPESVLGSIRFRRTPWAQQTWRCRCRELAELGQHLMVWTSTCVCRRLVCERECWARCG